MKQVNLRLGVNREVRKDIASARSLLNSDPFVEGPSVWTGRDDSPFNSGGCPGCFPECPDCGHTEHCVVVDTFTRSLASSFGTTDTGHLWEELGSRSPSVDGDEGIIHPEPGFVGISSSPGTSHTGWDRLDLSSESELFLPVVGTFKFKYTGTWEATYAYNRVPDTFSLPDTTYWTPGYAELETRTNNGGGITWVRPFLILRTTSSVPHHRFHIYNADGALWVSHAQSNSVAGAHFEPTLIMSSLPANTYVWVKVMIDSDRVYIRLWLDGDAEPGYWQESTEAVGQTWDERTFDLISVGSAKNDNQEPFDLYIDDVCIAALDHDDCGGGYFSSLMRNETGLYSVAGGAQIDLVYFDDIPALEGDHYTLSGSTITPLTTLDPETQVRARYRLGIS